jgi:hypothetical protein
MAGPRGATPRTFSGVLLILSFTVAGAVLGIALGQVADAGYFERWRRVNPPPAEAAELGMSNSGYLFARSVAGDFYRRTYRSGEGWLWVEAMPDDERSIVK